ncbi:hypothetical protein [Kibdelosporangium aridum]|uniref:hypothetical protein n=1 Tax=Kibdelosporangium aridum TaxID=2030 RepID=UPI0035F00E79
MATRLVAARGDLGQEVLVTFRHRVCQFTDTHPVEPDLDGASTAIFSRFDRAPGEFGGHLACDTRSDRISAKRLLMLLLAGDGHRYLGRKHEKTGHQISWLPLDT